MLDPITTIGGIRNEISDPNTNFGSPLLRKQFVHPAGKADVARKHAVCLAIEIGPPTPPQCWSARLTKGVPSL